MNSTLVQDAVIRNLQILAESTKRLSDALKERHQEIDWRGIAGFRNVLVHDYLGLDVNLVWDIVARDLPDLKMKIKEELKDLEHPPKVRKRRNPKGTTRKAKRKK